MKKYNYSNEIANVVKQFLTDDDWHYSFDEERGIFDFGLRVRNKNSSDEDSVRSLPEDTTFRRMMSIRR